jgi:Tfp pilus assembly pilus retraction ATPase PilT
MNPRRFNFDNIGMAMLALFEVLKGTFNVGYLIRDNKSNQIPSLMQLGRRIGMQTVDQALMELIESDLIRPEVAWEMAETPDDFLHLCPAGFHGDAADDKGEAMTT